jgi:uncharacterized repeat protein (TIGR03843 family)
VEVKGRLPWSSNATLLVRVGGKSGVDAVYKFTRGERELWDFEPGLWKREVAAFELARVLGWDMVPPTLARVDGPFGEGSLQLFVASDFSEHYFTIRDAGQHDNQLQRIAVFDILANNADRKGGHILLGEDGHLWGIDHGLCFSPVHHLRTVMWDYAGDPLPEVLRADIEKACDPSALDPLRRWLTDDEVESITWRARTLLDDGTFPLSTSERQLPWPLV